MNDFLLGAVAAHGLMSLLLWVAIACIVVFAILQLVKWAGIQIPEPVKIIFWAFLSIGLILLIARFFGLMA